MDISKEIPSWSIKFALFPDLNAVITAETFETILEISPVRDI